MVQLRGARGRAITVRALIDACSEVTLTSMGLAHRLGASLEPAASNISGVGGTGTMRSPMTAQLQLQTRDSAWSLQVTAHCLTRLGLRTPSAPLPAAVVDRWRDLPDLSDPTFGIPGDVDILLGAEVYSHLLRPGLLLRGNIVGQLTVAGWALTGREPCHSASASVFNCLATQDADTPLWHDQLVALMQRFWDLEDVPRVTRQSPDDAECEAIFAQHYRSTDGRYVVRLPLRRGGAERLGESLPGAMASLRSLRRRLQRDPEMAAEYAHFMGEYLRCGHMRPLTDAETRHSPTQVHYIPHHGIWQSGDQRKRLRVVFNASRPTSTGHSLNDLLHAGPKLQTCLPTVLLRWRRHRVAFCADIQMMFRQILVDERDVDLQRILWSADDSSPPQHFQLLTVTYGEACAPYLSLRTILQLCADEGHAWPEAVSILRSDRYVDDVLSGADDVQTARRRRDQLIGLLQAGGFPLKKWVANEPALLCDLSADSCLRPTWRQLGADGLVSELGVSWDPVGDCFHLTTPALEPQQTKRTMLAALARLFDPCGWIAPAILVAKLVIQDLWRARLDWDEIVPPSITQRWHAFLSQLQGVSELAIPRWINSCPAAAVQLHAFADASRRAMAAVVYSRVDHPTEGVRVRVLISRTKLNTIKSLQPNASRPARMTIPRLELRAALLAAKLLRMVAEEYAVDVDCCHAWSDSQIVLHWLRSSEPTNNSLIDNYVAHIQEILPSRVWRHVPTESNPADVASRGTDLATLRGMRLWWEGPLWLTDPMDSWPAESTTVLRAARLHSDGVEHICCATRVAVSSFIDKFSDLDRLLRFVARLRRWVRRRALHDTALPVIGPPTAAELRDAYLACVRVSQQQAFSSEIESLRQEGRVATKNPLLSLHPVLVDDVLRVGGRLQHSALSFDERHPPILDGQCSLAQLVIRWAHTRALHGGDRVTSAYVARKAWIIGGRRRIKGLVKACVICARLQARPAAQHMAPLPAARITPARAFARTGVDYAGPFNILSAKGRGIRTSKGYVAVFICLTTKAVHLELVGDLSTESFLGALTRLCARRGRPTEIWSDNATCFRSADRELREALQAAELQWERIAGSLAADGITWRFIPPRAPHFGGLWEAGVKSMKRHLRRVIGPRNLTYEEFSTALSGIEAVLNGRPLTPLTGGADDLDVLTPGHFLIGGPLNSVVDATMPPETLDRLAHWKLVRGIRDQFWRRWSREYLNTLQQRPKWRVPRRNFQVEDIVALVDDTLLQASGTWPLGRIISVHPGSDGLVRAATVRTATGEYVRPISKLALLPVHPDEASNDASLDPAPATGLGTAGGD